MCILLKWQPSYRVEATNMRCRMFILTPILLMHPHLFFRKVNILKISQPLHRPIHIAVSYYKHQCIHTLVLNSSCMVCLLVLVDNLQFCCMSAIPLSSSCMTCLKQCNICTHIQLRWLELCQMHPSASPPISNRQQPPTHKHTCTL
jgi:hypothetical protein